MAVTARWEETPPKGFTCEFEISCVNLYNSVRSSFVDTPYVLNYLEITDFLTLFDTILQLIFGKSNDDVFQFNLKLKIQI